MHSMDESDRFMLLRGTELFRDAPPHVLRELATACDVIELPSSAVVFEKGSEDDGMYFVADGELELFIGDATLDRLASGTCFGEMALLTEHPRTASVRTVRQTQLLRLSRAGFRDLLTQHPETSFGIIRELATKIRSSIDVRLHQHESLRLVREAFERSVSKAVMDEVLTNSDPVALMHGKETRATVAFADIRGFTSIAERMSPSETIHYLNEYLGALVDNVMDAGGTIDKFIGDAIMAYFGAPLSGPDDARRAVKCVGRMPEILRAIAESDTGRGRRAPKIGVGVASGLVVAGCVGNARRMEYTVLGDPVNLASRIEGLTKVYGSLALMCGETAKAVGGDFPLRRVDVVRVKGKSMPTELFDILPSDASANGLGDAYCSALSRYQAGDFEGAAGDFSDLRRSFERDGPTLTLAERCAAMARSPPAAWDGVFEVTSK